MAGYWRFFRDEVPLLGYGLSLTFFSSFGQTFLISLFVPFFLVDFSLSNGEFGTLYSLATLGSALLLPWTGRWMDRTSLPRFTGAIVLLVAVSSLVLAASWNVILLFVGLLGMRLAGPGLAAYTALTAMARHFAAGRGKALSISSLGFPLGEAVLPLLGAAVIAGVGWRGSWLLIGSLGLLFFAPLFRGLLARSGVEADARREARSAPVVDRERDGARVTGTPPLDDWAPPPVVSAPAAGDEEWGARSWGRREVLADSRFWFALPAALLPAFWATGIFLYQTSIAELKGWSLPIMASAFTAFALTRIAMSLLSGGLVDRFSARHVFPFSLLPLGGGLALLILFDGIWVPYGLMACLGVTTGMSGTVRTAMWAELYGVRYLGSIKAMMAALLALSTAGSPIVVGIVLDAGEGLDALLWGGIVSVGIGAALALTLYPR